MPIKSVLDFPNEIKKIVEMFYAGSTEAAYEEAFNVQDRRADLGLFVGCVLKLFEAAPPTPEAFNNKLLLHYQAASNSDSGFDAFEELMDLSSAIPNRSNDRISSEELRFHEELSESLAAETKLPSVLNDATPSYPSGLSSGVDFSASHSARRSSGLLGQAISIDIDIDFDVSLDETPDRVVQPEQRNSYDADEAYRRILAAKSYPTPPARSPVATGSVPSIMRAAQASEGLNDSKLGRRRTKTSDSLGLGLRLTPLDDARKRHGMGGDFNRRNQAYNDMPTVDQMQPVNGVTQINLQQVNASNKRQKIETLRDIDVDAVVEKAGVLALKPLNRIPVIKLSQADLARRQDIDAKAGYILSLVDGETSLLDIIDISSWTASETTDILAHLLAQSIIGF